MKLDQECSRLRLLLKSLEPQIKQLHHHIDAGAVEEIHANIQLALRHVEDATMRLGKVIQAYDGGKSVYDDKDKLRAEGQD